MAYEDHLETIHQHSLLRPYSQKEILLKNMPAIKPGVADAVMQKLLNPATGLTPVGEMDIAGIDAVLGLRSRYAKPSKQLLDHSAYIDLNAYKNIEKFHR